MAKGLDKNSRMTKHANVTTSVSALMGVAVADAAGRPVGRVHEFAVSPTTDASHVQALVLRGAGMGREKRMLAAVIDLELNRNGGLRLRTGAVPTPMPEDDAYLLLERDLLDQQIIDVHGHKVVRVNDVDLVWEAVNGDGAKGGDCEAHDLKDGCALQLRIAEVEVGTRGAVRRLLKGLPVTAVERISGRFRTTLIPWEFVDLIDREPARAERQALFTSLDEEVAAETLEEIEPRMQKALTESLDNEHVAGIVEEMDPAAAADFLAELPEERSEAILDEMDPEERQDVEELLEFSSDTAAGEMTTDYVALPPDAEVEQAVAALKEFEGDLATLTHIFLVDETDTLHGLVPLVKVLLAPRDASLKALADDHTVTCDIHAGGKKVAELFDKYNLRALPVLNEQKKLAGVIYAEQVIAQLRTLS